MKKNRILLLFLILGALGASTWFIAANGLVGKFFNDNDPDRPPTGVEIDREEYLLRRNEQMDMLRGYDTAQQDSRTNSIREIERSERALRANRRASDQPETSWVPLGPSPIPINGSTSYSGRVSAIAVHPTNPDIVYLGTAQGGLYRSLNGGTTWTPLMDSALTLAIGAIAISPSDPTTVFVGTGESTLCNSGCFIGVGLYRITNADTTPVLSDALNKNAANSDVFTGRAISEVLVHPTDPNTIFVATTSGIAGIGSSTTGLTLPFLGVYRSTNAMSANPTFELLDMGISERSVTDLVMEPGNPNKIYAGVLGDATTGGGGIYATSNALAATPTFTQVLSTSLTGRNSRVELTAVTVSGVTTVYAASGQGNGTIYVSPDSGPFTQLTNNSFCNPQCFYDIAIAVDPTNASKVYLGGSPNLPFGRSTNGGGSFANSASGLHVDSQVITVAPSNSNIVYFGSDGGVWRTTNVSATPIVWTSLNNSTLSATQFMGLAIHPTDRNYSLGGTQDNGTEFFAPDGVQWIQSDGGDGGFAVIDQTSPNTTNVVAYHTYYNSSGSQIGFTRATSTVPPGDPNWGSFLGCGGTSNGINCADSTLFYAPMVGGPNATGSTGNTLYFGTDHLYRSINQGTTMTDVSGAMPSRISAIAIAPQNDDIRLVGLAGTPTANYGVYLSTTAGATTMTNVTGPIPGRYVGRIAIDPTNSNIAYVCLNGFGLASGQHVWKTTDLLGGSPTWTPAGSGIPDTPVDSFAIDPADTNTLFAGTDIGVFKSSDGGANWIPFSNGLPRVAVFGMAIQNSHRVLRISTHGRGMWDYDLTAAGSTPTATPTNTGTNTPTNTPTQLPSPVPEYDLRISQSAPSAVLMHFPLTYTLTVSNVPTPVGGVNACPNVRFGYPTGTSFSFGSASGTNGYNAVPDVGGITFTGGCVASSVGMTGTATLSVTITPLNPGTLTSLGSNVVVDPENFWGESDETNNTAQTIQTIVMDDATPTASNTNTPTRTSTNTPTSTSTSTATASPTPLGIYIQFSSPTYLEDESQIAAITITRTGDISGTNTVSFSTAHGTAYGGSVCSTFGGGSDYIDVTGHQVTFNPNETSKTVSVMLCGDGLAGELDETVNLLLTGANAGPLAEAVLTINDTATAFEKQDNIAINSGGAADLYPSAITVNGAPTIMGTIRVTVYDYSTAVPINVSFLLVGPGGQKFILMANAGGLSPSGPTTLTFADTAGQIVPFNGPLTTGDFEPTSYGSVANFPAPAPAGPYNLPGSTIGGTGSQMMGGSPAGTYAGTNPNGIWRLYVREQAPPPLAPSAVVGNIAGGWGIEFIESTAAQASISGRVITANGEGIRNAKVVITGNSLADSRVVTTGSFGYFAFDGLATGETYVVTVNSRRYTFSTPSHVINLAEIVTDADFIAEPID